MYIPVVTGAFKPKHAGSATPFYHKVAQLKPAFENGKYNLANFARKLAFAKQQVVNKQTEQPAWGE